MFGEDKPSQAKTSLAKRRVGGPGLLLLLILVLTGGTYFGYLYAREGTLWGAVRSFGRSSADAAQSARVKAGLALSKRVSAFDVSVDSRQGEVTLRGTVPSEEVRALAESIAADTGGVTRVRNELLVDPGARPNPEVAALGDRVRDLELRVAVVEALATDPGMADARLVVTVDKRRARLTGTTATAAQKTLAEDLARGVPGVDGVDSQIQAASGEAPPLADAELAARVTGRLRATGAFLPDAVAVEASGGRIVLRGQVRTLAEKLLAEALARLTEGVGDVANDVSVASTAPLAAAAPEAAPEAEPMSPATPKPSPAASVSPPAQPSPTLSPSPASAKPKPRPAPTTAPQPSPTPPA